MADDLLAQLRAALDEDERAALAATAGPWYALANGSITHAGHEASLHGSRWGMYVVASTGAHSTRKPSDPDAHHIARHDPARVLRWVAAAREVLERHTTAEDDGSKSRPYCGHCRFEPAPCPDVRALAGVYGIGEG